MTHFSPAPPSLAAEGDAFGPDLCALLRALRQQVELYEQLHVLASRQGELIARTEADALLDLLAQRQRIIDHLRSVERRAQPVRPAWDVAMALCDDAQRLEIGDLSRRVDGLRDAISQLDRDDQANLRQVQAGLAAQMDRVTHAGPAIKAYGAAGAAGPAGGSSNKPEGDFAAWLQSRVTSRFTDSQG